MRTLLEKGGLLEKTERPSIAIGKAKLEKEKLAKAKTKDEKMIVVKLKAKVMKLKASDLINFYSNSITR